MPRSDLIVAPRHGAAILRDTGLDRPRPPQDRDAILSGTGPKLPKLPHRHDAIPEGTGRELPELPCYCAPTGRLLPVVTLGTSD